MIKILSAYIINSLILCLIFKEIDVATFCIASQFLVLEYYLAKSIQMIIGNLRIKNQSEKITKNDEEKYKYFRDKLQDLTIGEIGYLYNKSNIDELIAATLESLKLRNIIKIEEKKIIYNQKHILSLEEEYLINNASAMKTESFKRKFKEKINQSLVKKGYIENRTRISEIIDHKLVLTVMPFLLSYGIGLNYENKAKFSMNMICFLSFFIIFGIYALQCNLADKKICIRTKLGNELYLKLLGLKNFLNDFGSFEKKDLDEIALWEEYILYAIILNCSDALDKDLKEEYKLLLEITEK